MLVDTRDRLIPQLAYVVEENIELAPKRLDIYHPLVNEYFESSNRERYLMRPKVKRVYPHD